ncbi:MAG: CDP-alcohol phosphatidyltransferase family protein [Deinococcales bacterium]
MFKSLRSFWTWERRAAYAVHIYTASTLFFVSLALDWIVKGQYHLALLAMAITVFIDATDGNLARKYNVKERAMAIDGSLLDNIIDFISYVLLPMFFAYKLDMLLSPVITIAFVMFASAFGFSRTTAKLSDQGFFVGFPSYWNIVVFYLYLWQSPAWFNTLLLCFLAVLVFVPVRFLYITRMPKGKELHTFLSFIWGMVCLIALAMPHGEGRQLLLYMSLIYPIYYTLDSLQHNWIMLRNHLEDQLSIQS